MEFSCDGCTTRVTKSVDHLLYQVATYLPLGWKVRGGHIFCYECVK